MSRESGVVVEGAEAAWVLVGVVVAKGVVVPTPDILLAGALDDMRTVEPVGAQGINLCSSRTAEDGDRGIAEIDGLVDHCAGRVVLADQVTLYVVDILIDFAVRHGAPGLADALAKAVDGIVGCYASGNR